MRSVAIGARFREERARLKLSQTAFATITNADRHTVARYEAGSWWPTAPVLAMWYKAGVDTLYIVTGRRDPLLAVPAHAARPVSIADALASISAQVAPARVRFVIETADEVGA